MSTKAIEVSPASNSFAVITPGEAIRQKEQALKLAEVITKITNAEEQEAAIIAAGRLKGLSQAVEQTRKEIKKPFLDAGKAIDAKAYEYCRDIDLRVAEIEKLVGSFQRAQRQKEEEAERAAKKERDRAQAALNIAQIREHEAKTEKERLAAQLDLMEAQDEVATATATVVSPAIPAAKGAAVQEKVEFEVTDIEAFYAWDVKRRKDAGDRTLPTFVKLEVRKAEFNSFINIIGDAALAEIPGVKFTNVTKAATRGISPTIALS